MLARLKRNGAFNAACTVTQAASENWVASADLRSTLDGARILSPAE
jgi:hypothetical protein